MMVAIKSKTAVVHTGTATLVRKSRGIPVTVIPIRLKIKIMPKHILWHICQEPSMLAAPDTVPVAPISFSFAFLI